MNFAYDPGYFPAAPVAEVAIINAAESLRSELLTAFVDTGGDGTLVPVSLLAEIQAPPTVEMMMRSQWGERRRVLMYLVDIRVGDITLAGVEVVGDEVSDEIILGRDVLNRLLLHLDGPNATLTISESS